MILSICWIAIISVFKAEKKEFYLLQHNSKKQKAISNYLKSFLNVSFTCFEAIGLLEVRVQVAAKFGLRYIYKCRQVKTPITSVSNEVWNSSGLSD